MNDLPSKTVTIGASLSPGFSTVLTNVASFEPQPGVNHARIKLLWRAFRFGPSGLNEIISNNTYGLGEASITVFGAKR
jgi:hypothetical protein